MQNRVNPYGEIIDTKARGAWMGNRGHLHNDAQQIVCSYKLKAWITCLLEFNGRHREIMAHNRYTELFFFDEATAFAAGHRPCFECRRQDYNRFKELWLKGNNDLGFSANASVKNIDEILHNERMKKDGTKKIYTDNIHNLPDGTFISIDDKAYLIAGKHLHLWTVNGYTKKSVINDDYRVNVLTPKTIVNTFKAGYMPQMKV